MKSLFYLSYIFLLILTLSTNAYAWGGRGHAAICDAAIRLVKDENLKTFLSLRTHAVMHLCNIPDTYWRDLGAKSEEATPTHYFEPDLVSVAISEVPTEWVEAKKMLATRTHKEMKVPIKSVAKELGTLWWRAEQLQRMGRAELERAKNLQLPVEKSEKQNGEFPYNKAIFAAMTDLGTLGHFVGDASQPLHNTSNYDGYDNGHGGLHNYYEEKVVAEISGELVGKIVAKAKSDVGQKKFLSEKTTPEKMKALALLSYADLKELFSKDKVKKQSEILKGDGLTKKVSAERAEAREVVNAFEPLIVKEMARSALLLANLWEEAYVKAGKPNLSAYESYRFPHQPEIILPDYDK